MRELAILIPFKAREPKSRLAGVLPAQQRTEFARAMLLDVLAALAGAGVARDCYVISSDEQALLLADRSGAHGLREPSDLGVNGAVEWGIRRLRGRSVFMVLPSDIPLLGAAEVEAALSLKSQGVDAVVSPSKSYDGTNLLLFAKTSPIDLSYDRDSFWNHVASAAERRLSLAVYAGEGVLFDVDSEEDLLALSRTRLSRRSVAFVRKALP